MNWMVVSTLFVIDDDGQHWPTMCMVDWNVKNLHQKYLNGTHC